ncbi:MAG: hypothetical protein AAB759_01005 [Patescibacteria group bacterium]
MMPKIMRYLMGQVEKQEGEAKTSGFARYATIAFVVLLAFVVLYYLGDILMGWSLYSWFFARIHEGAGLNDLLAGAMAVWCMAIVVIALPTLASSFLWKNRRKAILMVATGVSVWFVGFYFLSQPKEGQFFSPITGKAQYRYARARDGTIEIFPLGYRYHPRYGTKLEELSTEAMREYDDQRQRTIDEKARAEAEARRLQSELEQQKQRTQEQTLAAEVAAAKRATAEAEARHLQLELQQEKQRPLDLARAMAKNATARPSETVPATALANRGIVAPVGGRLYFVRVMVDPARSWAEVVRAVYPNTADDSNVWKIGDLYPTTPGPAVNREIILANFGNKRTFPRDVIAWAETNRLKREGPRGVFAIAEQNPNLDKVLGRNPISILSFFERSFAAGKVMPVVWWEGANRGTGLSWGTIGVYGDDWIAFVRE